MVYGYTDVDVHVELTNKHGWRRRKNVPHKKTLVFKTHRIVKPSPRMASSTDGSPTGSLNWQTHSTLTYHTNRTEGSGRRTDYDKPNWWVDFCIHRRLQWWLTAADGLTDWGRGGTHCYTFANPEPTLNISRLSNQRSLKRTNTQFKCWLSTSKNFNFDLPSNLNSFPDPSSTLIIFMVQSFGHIIGLFIHIITLAA